MELDGAEATTAECNLMAEEGKDDPAQASLPYTGKSLSPGDFYITRHSNLAAFHVVFHLVSERAGPDAHELSTRGQMMSGLRQIIRTSFECGVLHLTIPLLLVSELTADMDVRWCLKRAELVLKCTKVGRLPAPSVSSS